MPFSRGVCHPYQLLVDKSVCPVTSAINIFSVVTALHNTDQLLVYNPVFHRTAVHLHTILAATYVAVFPMADVLKMIKTDRRESGARVHCNGEGSTLRDHSITFGRALLALNEFIPLTNLVTTKEKSTIACQRKSQAATWEVGEKLSSSTLAPPIFSKWATMYFARFSKGKGHNCLKQHKENLVNDGAHPSRHAGGK